MRDRAQFSEKKDEKKEKLRKKAQYGPKTWFFQFIGKFGH